MPNYTYKVEHSGQVSIQNVARLKSYWAIPDAAGQASLLLKPTHRSIMREQAKANRE